MTYLSVVKFHEYQHYTKRRPPWVKLYVKLLDPDNPLNRLPVSTRYLFHMLLLLAAECDNSIPNDFEWIVSRLRIPPQACREGLDDLAKGRWIRETKTRRRASKPASNPASDVLAPESREQRAEKDSVLAVSTKDNGGIQADLELAVSRLLASLKDKDDRTHLVVRGIVTGGKLAVGDVEWARECAHGPGVISQTRVAVAELKKRALVA